MLGIVGIGWIDGEAYGRGRGEDRNVYTPDPGLTGLWQDKNVFLTPVKNYGRFDTISKFTCCAAALALRDAGISNRRAGILGTNRNGCLESNREYFRDYVDCGRTLSRGNLFIYTLPSSPLAEAAIHLKLAGPTLYMTGPKPGPALLFNTAARMITVGDSEAMLTVQADDNGAVCFVIGEPGKSKEMMCGLDDALTIVENTDCTQIGSLVKGFADL